MKLFDSFEAVRFPEENLILITNNGFIYYVYDPDYKNWKKYKNCGEDSITVANYQEITEDELKDALQGIVPQKETDFSRFCNPSQLNICDMSDLLEEDYHCYMSDSEIHYYVIEFLRESTICYKSYLVIKALLAKGLSEQLSKEQLICRIKELSLAVIGRDIFTPQIRIIDGHDCSSYFWIMPARIIDYTDTNELDNVAEMRSVEISIEEDDVDQYLSYYFRKYFDSKLNANQKRVGYYFEDDDGTEQITYITDFEWYLTYNFYTFDSIRRMIAEIRRTVSTLDNTQDRTQVCRDDLPSTTPIVPRPFRGFAIGTGRDFFLEFFDEEVTVDAFLID